LVEFVGDLRVGCPTNLNLGPSRRLQGGMLVLAQPGRRRRSPRAGPAKGSGSRVRGLERPDSGGVTSVVSLAPSRWRPSGLNWKSKGPPWLTLGVPLSRKARTWLFIDG
jgi:hypothetical protein